MNKRKRQTTRVTLDMSAAAKLYALEKFSQAVHTLATHKNGIRDRLWFAWRDIHSVSPANMPKNLRKDLEQLRTNFSRLQPNKPDQDPVSATISKIRLNDCESLAGQILELEIKLQAQSADAMEAE